MIEWKEQRFSDINTKEFYEIFKFRCEVFVVEQEILYNDFDSSHSYADNNGSSWIDFAS